MMKEIKDHGVEVYRLPKEEEDRWFKGFQAETRKWVEALESKGQPAREAVKMYSKIVEQKGLKCAAFPPEWH
jgi:hypothetical protein